MCKIKVYSSYYNLRHVYTCTSFALHWVKIQYLSSSYRWFFSLKIYNIIKVLQLKFDVRFNCPRKAFYSDERLAYFLVRYFMYMYILQYVRSLPVAVGCFTKWCSRCIFISTFKERPCFITKCLYTHACAGTECKCI